MKVSYVTSTHPNEFGDLKAYIAFVARVSNPSSQTKGKNNDKLLNYLIRNKHWSPFEMASITMQVDTTRDIARQILRHRSFSFQEFSQRYAKVTDDPNFQFVIREARLQDEKNRQNSIEVEDTDLSFWWSNAQQLVIDQAVEVYNQALERGIAKEVARAVLPEGNTPSRIYMAGTVRSWIHYCQLRGGNGTQKEHMEVAKDAKIILNRLLNLEEGVLEGL